ncbi:hypothetical protein LOTGIDRAFT_112328 [Lottia gigantea]|uniref:thiopurine S-methyltransferase n=1 Tax=Lottia gigantea TaxID=225164 RepID=V4CEX6_LOTGI|nr:hypothetical protein LOTGIDRAFT_112328 [Lottia gigantea]ESP00540.1 hypothetical protein LOTGIDRAFT_112328 [Lottia gigantea]
MTVEDWEKRWKLEQTGFHMDQVHPMLVKYYSKLTRDKPKLRFYLPLCGKSVDLKWLSDNGHDVVGCDGSDIGCQDFFKENSLPYTSEALPESTGGGVLYQNKEKNIKLYRCDFFKLSPEIIGQFDCIWDRGSFVAIPVTERGRYAELILQSLKPTGRYLLDTFQLPHQNYQGPPFNTEEDEVNKYFGQKCTIEKLAVNNVFNQKHLEQWKVEYFNEIVYLLTSK